MFKPRAYSATKLDISQLPFDLLAETCQNDYSNAQAHVDSWAEQYAKHKTWVYPQMLALIGRWTPVRNESGEFCGKLTVSHNCRTPHNRGIYFFAMSSSRYVLKQTSKEGVEYCALVPIILSAFKKFQDIPYSAWSRDTLRHVVDARLCATMLATVPDYPRELLLQWRTEGLTVKTGPRSGTVKSATSTFGLYGLPKSVSFTTKTAGELVTVEGPGVLSKLSAMILCQTWCAHPQWRHKYMILSHHDWDYMPDPLILEDPLNAPLNSPEVKPKDSYPDLPWL